MGFLQFPHRQQNVGQGQPSGPSLGHYTNILQRFDAQGTAEKYTGSLHHYMELLIRLYNHFNRNNHHNINLYVTPVSKGKVFFKLIPKNLILQNMNSLICICSIAGTLFLTGESWTLWITSWHFLLLKCYYNVSCKTYIHNVQCTRTLHTIFMFLK